MLSFYEVVVIVGIVGVPMVLVFAFGLRWKGAYALGIAVAVAANLLVAGYEEHPVMPADRPGIVGQACAITLSGAILGTVFYAPAYVWRRLRRKR